MSVPPNELSRAVGAAAAEVSIAISADAGCTWSAASNATFLTLPGASTGTGSAALRIAATANAGNSRSGTVTIGDLTVTVTQAAAAPAQCSFAVTPTQIAIASGGGTADVNVTVTGNDCPWTATATDPFVSITSGVSGNESGRVSLTVASNPAGARTAPVVVAGQTVTINQAAAPAPACVFEVTPKFPSVSYQGGNVTVNVRVISGTNCEWTAAFLYPSPAQPARIVSGATGTGNGSVVVSIDPNPGTGRAHFLIIAGQMVSAVQDANPTGCQWTVLPSVLNVSASAQTAFVDATLTVGETIYCGFSIGTTGPTFMRVASIQTTGPNTRVVFEIEQNTGPARTQINRVGDKQLSINQAAPGPTPTPSPCLFTVSPTSIAISYRAQNMTINVTVPPSATGCNWTAVSNSAFLTVLSGASGSVSGSVTVAASENSILQRRTGTLTIAGQTVFVGQNTPLFAAVSLQSAPGDIIGQGVNRNYTLQEASIDAVNNTTTFGSMLITLRTPDGTWRLRLEAPAGTSLAPGDYNNAGKPPALPGLDFSRDSTTCSQISGRFRLGEVVYSPIDRFYRVNIVFEQRCNGSTSALVGNIWISSDGTTTPPPLALPGAAANIRR